MVETSKYGTVEENAKLSSTVLRTEQVRGKMEKALTDSGTDQFLENPPLQPKCDIANYVESCGIPVPRRFSGLKEALEFVQSGGEIIIRSEHPQEYNGVSGLLWSYIVNANIIKDGKEYCIENGTNIDWEGFYKQRTGNTRCHFNNQTFGQIDSLSQIDFENNLKRLSVFRIETYCMLSGMDYEDFSNQISYSYWEKLGGYNRSIVADSAIRGRYHIFTTATKFHNYLIIDNGNIVLNAPCELGEDLQQGLSEIIEFYEQVRSLEKFNSSHCPIIEFQTLDNKNYFLQYHRTRDENCAQFTLDRPLEEGEIEVDFVRGSTPPEGLTLDIVVHYSVRRKTDWKLDKSEQGSFDFHFNDIFLDLMSRTRIVNIINNSLSNLASKSYDAHLPKTQLFKPNIAIAITKESIPNFDNNAMFEMANETGKPSTIPMHIVSDGRRAYVKFGGQKNK